MLLKVQLFGFFLLKHNENILYDWKYILLNKSPWDKHVEAMIFELNSDFFSELRDKCSIKYEKVFTKKYLLIQVRG